VTSRANTHGRRILEYLADNPELGFRPTELADELDIPQGSVGTTLRRLESRGFVRHKGDYWTINAEAYDAQTASAIGLDSVAEAFRGDHYDQNPEWDAELSEIEADTGDSE
jgi:DNA-binding IclR family transcriptional regulator